MTDLRKRSEDRNREPTGPGALARAVLTSRGWLSRRSAAFQDTLLGMAQCQSFEPGQNVYLIGDEPQGLFGVVEGWVLISSGADDGQQRLVHASGPGFWIGDLALLAQGARLVTVTTVGAARIVSIPSSRIERWAQDEPAVIRDFYALSNENTLVLLRVAGMDRVTRADQRVALRLLHLAEEQPEAQPWLPLTQDLLASLCAMSVPSVQRALTRLAELGLLETGYGGLRLLDRDGLRRYGQS